MIGTLDAAIIKTVVDRRQARDTSKCRSARGLNTEFLASSELNEASSAREKASNRSGLSSLR